MVVNKKYNSFFIKNTLLIALLVLGCYILRITLKANMSTLTDNFISFELFLSFFTLITSLFYSDWIYQIENKGAMYRLLKEKNKFEVELLKSQFSPHFLFNTLNSIYSKCHNTSPDAAKMIYNLSNFNRQFRVIKKITPLAYRMNYKSHYQRQFEICSFCRFVTICKHNLA
jgi:two-component system LytT family sensor kinase